MSELTVIVKDADRTYRHKFLLYDAYTVQLDDPVIKECIDEAINSFKSDAVESVIVNIKMVVQ
jgi:hypothetical protein